MIVYVDTNVVRDLAERRVPHAEVYEAAIRREVQTRRIIIAPSLEVLYELLRSPDADFDCRIRNAQFYDSVVDWGTALKPSDGIIKDDIAAFVRCGRPSVPYSGIDGQRSGFIKSIRSGKDIFPETESARVYEETCRQNEKFAAILVKGFLSEVGEENCRELRNTPEQTWRRWWTYGGVADTLAWSLIPGERVLSGLSPSSLPSLRTLVGYLLRTWHQMICSGRKVRPTDHYDFRIAVQAGTVGRVLTGDRQLRLILTKIPSLSMRVWTLNEFVSQLLGKSN